MQKHKLFELITAQLHQYLSPKSRILFDQKIMGHSGIERQIDILIEDDIAVYKIKIIIDCKHYSGKVDIKDVEDVWGLVDDVRGNLAVIVSNGGFTEGAIKRANDYGRMKLCSIVDLENKEFSLQIALPVIAEYRRPSFQFSVAGTENISLYPNTKLWFIESKKDSSTVNIYNFFLELWNEGKLSSEPGDHVYEFSPDEWYLLGPLGKANFTVLKIDYEVKPRYFLGYVPLLEGKGIIDIQENLFKTAGFKTERIIATEVEEKWQRFDKREDIPVDPVFYFEALDMFLPIDLNTL